MSLNRREMLRLGAYGAAGVMRAACVRAAFHPVYRMRLEGADAAAYDPS